MDDKYKVPENDIKDTVHSVVRAGISAIPIVGGPATELFNMVIQSPIEKRRKEWSESVSKGLLELEETVESFSIDGLQNNESFISVLMQASQIAIKNHQKEKLEALKNAVINSASKSSIDEYLQVNFLDLIDRMSTAHIKVLNYYLNDKGFTSYSRKSLGMDYRQFEEKGGELSNGMSLTLFENVISDLLNMRLIRVKKRAPNYDDIEMDEDVELSVYYKNVITDLGKQFLEFIR